MVNSSPPPPRPVLRSIPFDGGSCGSDTDWLCAHEPESSFLRVSQPWPTRGREHEWAEDQWESGMNGHWDAGSYCSRPESGLTRFSTPAHSSCVRRCRLREALPRHRSYSASRTQRHPRYSPGISTQRVAVNNLMPTRSRVPPILCAERSGLLPTRARASLQPGTGLVPRVGCLGHPHTPTDSPSYQAQGW